MKKFILSCFVASAIFACTPQAEKTSSDAYPTDAVGYNLDSSANIDLVLKMTKAFESMDSAAYRATYADSAKFHDNGTGMTLEQNMSIFNLFKSKGISIKVEKIDPIWESVNKEASADGVTNYVFSYQHIVFTKGDKQVKFISNVVDGIKDGKIVEEWGLYDTKAISELIK
jgi:hypothetical protein